MIYEFFFSEEGSSEVLGYVLIFGLVISAMGIIVAFGLPTINNAKDNADYQNGLNSIKDIRNELDRISKGPIRGGGLSLKESMDFESGFVEFVPNSTRISVYEDGSLIYDEYIGSINYGIRDKVVALEANGVFMKTKGADSSSSLIDSPFFVKEIDSFAYVRFNVVDLNGDETKFSGNREVIFKNKNFSVISEAETVNDPVTQNVTIEISSDFSWAWEYSLSNKLDEEDINYTLSRDNRNLTLTVDNVVGEEDIYLSLYETDISYEVK